MDIAGYLSQLTGDGLMLADAAERAGWDARVPACDWTVRDVVTHVGGIHRWAADIVRSASPTPATELGNLVGTGPGDDELLAWFRAGHADLVDALGTAPDDLEACAFLPAPSPKHFWMRRQAHETAIHRADVESASGDVTAFTTDFAQDGIAEMLHGFAARKSNAIGSPGTIGLAADDGTDWVVSLGGERIAAEPGSPHSADAVVAGPSSDLYLWLWNRPSDARVTGDQSVAGAWRGVRVQWG